MLIFKTLIFADATGQTYKELMRTMGQNSLQIHQGILSQNSQMIIEAANAISHHALPNDNPWEALPYIEQETFKNEMIEKDLIIHQTADAIVRHVEHRHWEKAQKAFNELTLLCISCHTNWKPEINVISSHASTYPKPQSSPSPKINFLGDLPQRDIP